MEASSAADGHMETETSGGHIKRNQPSPHQQPQSRRASLALPFASQPDMVLAADKDAYYATQIKDNFKAALEALAGARRAELLVPEMQLLGDLLYYGFIIGAGAETLGQEYCNMMLVKEREGGGFLPLSRRRAVMAALLIAGLAYVSQRLLYHNGWSGDYAQLVRRRMSHAVRRSGAALTAQQSSGASGRHPAQSEGALQRLGDAAARSVSRVSSAWRVSQGERLGGKLKTALKHVLPESREAALRAAQRLHLLLFFLHGRYHSFALRLVGARTMFMRRVTQPRASYVLLGSLVLLELGLKAASRAVMAARVLLTDSDTQTEAAKRVKDGRVPGAEQAGAHDGLSPNDSYSMDEDVVGGRGYEDNGDREDAARRSRCPLCMGQRKQPAITSCGHVFCWACIHGWLNEQQECPLCRSAVLPQTVLRVVNLAS